MDCKHRAFAHLARYGHVAAPHARELEPRPTVAAGAQAPAAGTNEPGAVLRDDAIARRIDAGQRAGGIGDHPDAGRVGGDAALAVADRGSDAGGDAVRRLIDSIDEPVAAARRPHAAKAGGKPATEAVPVATIASVFGSARATLLMSPLETQTAPGAMAIQSGAPGIEISAITGSDDSLTEVRSGMVTLPQTSAVGRVSPQRKNT